MINRNSSNISTVETDPSVIRAELARLLSERRFAGAPQMSAFLRYIVEETLEGNAERIKAFSVGVDALGKPDTFDAQTDPSVRVLALRLRKTLDAIYEDTSKSLAIIELKVGTYVPAFSKVSSRASDGDAQDINPVLVAAIRTKSTAELIRESDSNSEAVHMERSGRTANSRSTPTGSEASGNLLAVAANSRTPRILASVRSVNSAFSSRGVLVAGTVLLIAAWQIAASKSDVQAGVLGSPTVTHGVFAANQTTRLDDTAKVQLASKIPVIVIRRFDHALEIERRITLLLTSSLVQSDAVSVVREVDDISARQRRPGEYQLFIHSYGVDDQVRVDTQIVSLWNGEMLFAETLILEQSDQQLSAADLGAIESLATGITKKSGAVFHDYCTRYGGRGSALAVCPTV